MSKTFERRMGASVVELREASDAVTLTGYASTYDQPYDMGWYKETVAPGAFRASLGRTPDVRLLINHGGLPLARTASGTLTLDGEDKQGLRVSATLDPSDPDVAALVPKMRRGDLNQMSFSFRVSGDEGDEWSKDMTSRTLRTLDIHDGDVSMVTYPANPGTSAVIRSTGQTPVDAVASALRCLENREASPEDLASILDRVMPYFRAAPIVDDAPGEPADAETVCACCDTDCCDCTDAECDGTCCDACPGPDRSAVVAQELRGRLLALLG